MTIKREGIMKFEKEVPIRDYIHSKGKKISAVAIIEIDNMVNRFLDDLFTRSTRTPKVISAQDIRDNK